MRAISWVALLLGALFCGCSDDTVTIAKKDVAATKPDLAAKPDSATKPDTATKPDSKAVIDAGQCPASLPTAGGACQLPSTQDCLYTSPAAGPTCEAGVLCRTAKTHCKCQSNLWVCVTEKDAGA